MAKCNLLIEFWCSPLHTVRDIINNFRLQKGWKRTEIIWKKAFVQFSLWTEYKRAKSGGVLYLPYKAPPRANLINVTSLYAFQTGFNQFRRPPSPGWKILYPPFVISCIFSVRGKQIMSHKRLPTCACVCVNLILHDISSIPWVTWARCRLLQRSWSVLV